MKPVLLLFGLVLTLALQAQNSVNIPRSTTQNGGITGTVQDSTGRPIAGATISLLPLPDSAATQPTAPIASKLAVTAADGSYSFGQVPAGNYRIEASFSGYASAYSDPVKLNGAAVQIEPLKLKTLTAELQAVVVTAQKPLIEVKADKMIVNVEGTVNATGSDALELLRKSPGIYIDKDDRISMNGKNGVQIYVDGKPSPLAAQDLAAYLRSLQSSQVASIELITNPSAKYEAAGNAGIINIRLKKNLSLGANGTVQAGYNIAKYGKFNSGFNLNYRNQKANFFGSYNYAQAQNESRLTLNRILADSVYNTLSTMTFSNQTHQFKAGADFFLHKRHILGVLVNGTLLQGDLRSDSRTEISQASTKKVGGVSNAQNNSDLERNNLAYNLNYQFTGEGGKSLSVNADYARYESGTVQLQNSTIVQGSQTDIRLYEVASPGDISITSAKADWEQNWQKGRLSLGAKSAFVDSDNDFRQYNLPPQGKQMDMDKSNQFTYRENIHAAYVNYNRQFKGVLVQAGLRAENTVSQGNSQGYDGRPGEKFEKNYTDVFPSATISLNKNPKKQFSVSYSRRIDRPAYQQLNPFEFKIDEYTYGKGNIHLKPQYTNSYGLTWVYKYKLNATLNYSHVRDMIAQITDSAGGNKLLITSGNLARQDVVSLNVSYPFQFKTLSLFANIGTNYSNYAADFGKDRKVEADAFALTTVLQGNYAFAKDWTAQMTGFYSAPTIYQGTFKAKSMWSIDAGIQRQLLNKRLSIKASVSDIFKSLAFDARSSFAAQNTRLASHWESRQFKLNLTYRFGRNEVKPARVRKTAAEEESSRAKSSGGGISIGQ